MELMGLFLFLPIITVDTLIFVTTGVYYENIIIIIINTGFFFF
jgi:hypothetical protein